MDDLITNFSRFFWTEIDVQKSYDESGEGKRYIFGRASSGHVDDDGDIILQQFLDITPFVERGFFNYEHKDDPEYIVGFPYKEECKVTEDGFYVAGELFKNHPVADKLWDLIVRLKRENIPRKLYFSIEGKATRYASDPPGVIRGFRVYDVAITRKPVNTNTYLDAIVKSVQVDGSPALYVINPHEMVSGTNPLRKEFIVGTAKILTYLLRNKESILSELRKKGELTREEALIYALLTTEALKRILDLYEEEDGGVLR